MNDESVEVTMGVTLHHGMPFSPHPTARGRRHRAGSERTTALRVGREVPVPVTSIAASPSIEAGSRAGAVTTSFPYRNVGMTVAGSAGTEGDRYRIRVNIERSAVYEAPDPVSRQGAPRPLGLPSFQTLAIGDGLLLGDGEHATLASVGPGVGKPADRRRDVASAKVTSE